jgi:hypothetical protein
MRRRRAKPALYKKPSKPELPDPETQAVRQRYMTRYDGLAPEIRAALQACPWDIHIGLRGNLNIEAVVGRIKAIKTMDDALKFNQEFSRRTFGRAW